MPFWTLPMTSWPDSVFWDFSLDLYLKDGVDHACLALQDQLGLNVNMLLFALWLGHRGVSLDPVRLRQAEVAIAPWQEDLIVPLRAVRRTLASRVRASGDEHLSEPWRGHASRLKKNIQALELDGEHLVQLTLDDLAAGWQADGLPGLVLAGDNLRVYRHLPSAFRGDIDCLFEASFPDAVKAERASVLKTLMDHPAEAINGQGKAGAG